MKTVLLLHFRDDSMVGHILSQIQIIAPSLTFQKIVYRISDAQKTRLRKAAARAPTTLSTCAYCSGCKAMMFHTQDKFYMLHPELKPVTGKRKSSRRLPKILARIAIAVVILLNIAMTILPALFQLHQLDSLFGYLMVRALSTFVTLVKRLLALLAMCCTVFELSVYSAILCCYR